MLCGIDPERHEHGLVHLPLDALIGFARPLRATALVFLRFLLSLSPLLLVVVEHARRVVLDPQYGLAFELFAAREVVVAALELEVHEVRFGDESRRRHGRRARRTRAFVDRWRWRLCRRRAFAALLAGTLVAGALVLLLEPCALPSRPLVLVFRACVIADGDAVEPDRAPDVQPVADVPGELVFLPEERHPGGSQDLDLLFFVQHVSLEDLTILIAALQHLLHERVELVERFGRRFRRSLCG